MTSPSNDQTPAPAGDPSAPVVARPHRPWLGPAIASGVVAAVILLLLIPNVLIYPRPAVAGHVLPPGALEESNAALEERARTLRALVQSGVCEADGRYRLTAPTPGGPTQEDLDNVMPPELSESAPTSPAAPGAPGNLAQSQNQNAFLDTVDKGVVLVDVPGKGSGTGFFIASDLVVTNAHVADVPLGSRVKVLNKAIGKPADAIVEASSGHGPVGQRDFALLRLQGASAPKVLSLATTPERMQAIVAAGFPGIIMDTDPNYQALSRGDFTHMPDPSTSSGMVTHVQASQGGDVIVHSAQIAKGNSGGPLMDRCGRVSGVNTYIIRREDDHSRMNYALSSDALVTWLKENNVTVTADTSACTPSAGTPAEQE